MIYLTFTISSMIHQSLNRTKFQVLPDDLQKKKNTTKRLTSAAQTYWTYPRQQCLVCKQLSSQCTCTTAFAKSLTAGDSSLWSLCYLKRWYNSRYESTTSSLLTWIYLLCDEVCKPNKRTLLFFRPSFRELHLSKNTRGMYEIATGLDLFKKEAVVTFWPQRTDHSKCLFAKWQ